MNCREIVRDWLKRGGYDGLCAYDCGCGLDDLMPCDGLVAECVPAYRGKLEDGEDGYVPLKEGRK